MARRQVALCLGGWGNLINQRVDILMLGMMGSTEEDVIYSVVVRAASLVASGLAAVNMIVSPHFARLHAQGDMAPCRI